MNLLFERKKILSVLVVLTLVSFSLMIPLAFAAGEADLETMKSATVRVVITLQGQYIGHGSGFVIDDGKHIVTNYHVIRDVEAKGAQAWVALGRGSGMLRALEIRATSPRNDIAVLSVDQKLAKPSVKLVRREDIKQGESVTAVGYPGSVDLLGEGLLNSLNNPPVPTPGSVVQKLRNRGGAHIIQITADTTFGSSGGPVFNAYGHVVGMATFGLQGETGSSNNYCVDSEEIMEVVRSTKAAVEIAPAGGTKPATPTPDQKIQDEAQKLKDQVEKERIAKEQKEQQEKEQQNKMMMYGGAAVGVILLVVVIVMVTRKKPTQAPMPGPMPGQMHPGQMPGQIPGAAPMPPTAAAPQTRPVSKRSMISGISGFFAGKSMEIPAGRQMIFGRDPQQAQLVFPSDMNEISRIHCVVSFDAGTQSFVVEDRSSNGTFLVSGQRISGQARLKSGERFYLSEPNNMFEVRAD